MFNPVHHHCHFFTDFYKRFICAEPKPLLTARKSDTPILWKACLLVVTAGLDPRTYSIGTLQEDELHPPYILHPIYHSPGDRPLTKGCAETLGVAMPKFSRTFSNVN